jgi:hypothetical protein
MASPMENFILLFLIVPCHLNYFEITNETSTMHDFFRSEVSLICFIDCL